MLVARSQTPIELQGMEVLEEHANGSRIEAWWAGGDSNSRPYGPERVSACKADVLSGG